MAERLKALDSKSSRQTEICLEGSNPLSAIKVLNTVIIDVVNFIKYVDTTA